MAGNELTLKDIQQILDVIRAAEDIQEFSLKFGGAEIQISRSGGRASEFAKAPQAASQLPEPVAAPPPQPAAQKAAPAEGLVSMKTYGPTATLVKASMVGVFYHAPAPGEPPFVEVGQRVQKDQVLGILEVMKLMNSISAPVAGTVKDILVPNGEPVEFDQLLIVIEGD